MNKKFSVLLFAAMLTVGLTSCGTSGSNTSASASSTSAGTGSQDSMVTLTCLADSVPHAEILKEMEPELEKEGIKLDIVSEQWDSTWNEQVENGTVDFHYDAYVPYLDEWNKSNGGDLVSAGSIHFEPLVMCSDKCENLSDLPDNATIAIKDDVTNQYRCLKLLEQAGLIELSKDMTLSNADVSYITKYNKPLKITAIDADIIMNTRSDFDAYITNVNRLLEAGLDPTKYLVKEKEENSIFANVICVQKGNENNENIKKLVAMLQSDKCRKFIEDTYKGAVEPAF